MSEPSAQLPSPTGLIGRQAPAFELAGCLGQELGTFRLADYRGKWVYLIFYPLDFSFVCPTEMLGFSRRLAEFTEMDCQLLGISVDSHYSHRAWIATAKRAGGLGGELAFPLLSDITQRTARAYGVLHEEAGVALRGLFLIDPHGVVMHSTINGIAVGRSVAEALRTLKAFRYVSEHIEEVSPVDWDEGQEAVEANPEGVRKYLITHL